MMNYIFKSILVFSLGLPLVANGGQAQHLCYSGNVDFFTIDKIKHISINLSRSHDFASLITYKDDRGRKAVSDVFCPLSGPGLCVIEDDGGDFELVKIDAHEVILKFTMEPAIRTYDNNEIGACVVSRAKQAKDQLLQLKRAKAGECAQPKMD